MSYQVLARKWRPQRFDEVVGQKGVTQTLRNAIATGRIAQAFVFAGARGVGKTTTARILARALNCEKGPTPDPCGVCDTCVEIAEGRDLDVLEIDAATHTGVDNVREVIIDGLQVRPARDRYKVFIIDEVHQLSVSSFNALLKSMEEPPPHVVFMMATTELHKIPETILSRAQVFELRTIGTRAIVDQLRRIADTEKVTITDEAIGLVARAAEGSMRDAQSALDQVMSFGGAEIDATTVAEVLGLVERDVLLDLLEVVANEDAPRVFDVAGRLVETGHDLRHVCRELARLIRDLMVLQVDPDAHQRSGVRDRRRRRSAAGDRVALLARGSAARVRARRQARTGRQGGRAAALPPRNGAAAVGAPAQAGAADGAARRRTAGCRIAGARLAASDGTKVRAAGAGPRARPAAHVVRAPGETDHAAGWCARRAPGLACEERGGRTAGAP